MSETQQNYFELLDVWDDWIDDWITENELREEAQSYLDNSWLIWEELNELKNKLWDLLQKWNIDLEMLKKWYEQAVAKIWFETSLDLILEL